MISPKDARKLAEAAPTLKTREHVEKIVHEIEVSVRLNGTEGVVGGRTFVGPLSTEDRITAIVEASRQLEETGWSVSLFNGWLDVKAPPADDGN